MTLHRFTHRVKVKDTKTGEVLQGKETVVIDHNGVTRVKPYIHSVKRPRYVKVE